MGLEFRRVLFRSEPTCDGYDITSALRPSITRGLGERLQFFFFEEKGVCVRATFFSLWSFQDINYRNLDHITKACVCK